MKTIARTASPAKLRDGTWGARLAGAATVGEVIIVRTAGGKSWQALVTAIVWRGADAAIVATQSLDRPVASSRTDDVSLAARGLIRVGGPKGSYVRRMTRDEAFDEL